MRRIPFYLLAVLFLALSGGCAAQPKEDEKPPLTAQARTALYQSAIESAAGPESNSFVELITSPEDQSAELIFTMLDLEAEDMTAFCLAISPVNVQAYGIAAVFPAAGKEDDVLDALNGFIDTQKENFQQYLEDEYRVASDARLETLEDGTILLVMCQEQDAVFDAIRDAIEAGQ